MNASQVLITLVFKVLLIGKFFLNVGTHGFVTEMLTSIVI
jgi:hypothetical protein